MLGAAPDLTHEQYDTIDACREKLVHALPGPTAELTSLADVDNITFEDALMVLRYQRRLTSQMLLMQEVHEHMGDDCGDYLMAATDCWSELWNHYFETDGSDPAFTSCVKAWLKMPVREWGACDGDVRFILFTDEYQEAAYED